MSAEDVLITTLNDVAEQALREARSHHRDAAEVMVSATQGFSLAVRSAELETLEHTNSRDMSVTVYRNQRKSSASTSLLSKASVSSLLNQVCDLNQYMEQDACVGLAAAELMATDNPDLQVDYGWDIDVDQATTMAVECERAMREVEQVCNTDRVAVETERHFYCYANSHDFMRLGTRSSHSISAIAVAGDPKISQQRDHWYTSHVDPTRLESPREVGRQAGQRAARRVGARRPRTGKVAVLFEAPAAKSLLSHLSSALSGYAIYRRASFLLDRVGQKICPDFVSVVEYPRLLHAAGSSAFDNEGVATQDRAVLDAGVLTTYLLDSYTACRLGMQTTGHAGGVRNLSLSGHHQLSDLLKKMDRGLFVTELIGSGVNLVNGDYSRGAAGFWVEHGAIAYPIEEATISANLCDMYKGIVGVGNDIDERGNIRSGSVLIDEMMVAGQS